jgi:predicted TIM-barrel fold metal-dependent hydrolase
MDSVTGHRAIVDTHRHPIGPKLAARMVERDFYDPKQEFPQTNARDLIGYREFYDLEYAMPKSREEGVTLSLASNGGEVEWFARDLLKVGTSDAPKILNDEYLEISNRYPGEFALMANAHLLEEECRPVVEEMIRKGGAKAIAVASSYGDGSERSFLDSPKAEWLWEFAAANDIVVHIHPLLVAGFRRCQAGGARAIKRRPGIVASMRWFCNIMRREPEFYHSAFVRNHDAVGAVTIRHGIRG